MVAQLIGGFSVSCDAARLAPLGSARSALGLETAHLTAVVHRQAGFSPPFTVCVHSWFEVWGAS